jgi:hypothetical protein
LPLGWARSERQGEGHAGFYVLTGDSGWKGEEVSLGDVADDHDGLFWLSVGDDTLVEIVEWYLP